MVCNQWNSKYKYNIANMQCSYSTIYTSYIGRPSQEGTLS